MAADTFVSRLSIPGESWRYIARFLSKYTTQLHVNKDMGQYLRECASHQQVALHCQITPHTHKRGWTLKSHSCSGRDLSWKSHTSHSVAGGYMAHSRVACGGWRCVADTASSGIDEGCKYIGLFLLHSTPKLAEVPVSIKMRLQVIRLQVSVITEWMTPEGWELKSHWYPCPLLVLASACHPENIKSPKPNKMKMNRDLLACLSYLIVTFF